MKINRFQISTALVLVYLLVMGLGMKMFNGTIFFLIPLITIILPYILLRKESFSNELEFEEIKSDKQFFRYLIFLNLAILILIYLFRFNKIYVYSLGMFLLSAITLDYLLLILFAQTLNRCKKEEIWEAKTKLNKVEEFEEKFMKQNQYFIDKCNQFNEIILNCEWYHPKLYFSKVCLNKFEQKILIYEAKLKRLSKNRVRYEQILSENYFVENKNF